MTTTDRPGLARPQELPGIKPARPLGTGARGSSSQSPNQAASNTGQPLDRSKNDTTPPHGKFLVERSRPVGGGTGHDVRRPLFAPEKNRAGNKWRILFIDDEEMVARMGNRTLTKLGYDVVVATTAKDAIELFERDPDGFDLVITDQTMPAMTGTALSKQLLTRRPELPIILTTGYSEKAVQEQTKDVQISAVLRKPIEIRSLSLLIHSILEESKDSSGNDQKSALLVNQS